MPIYLDPSAVEPPPRAEPIWSCGPARAEGDALVLDYESSRTYRLEEKPQIHTRFAAINAIDDAVDFVGEFGLLFHGALPGGTVPDVYTVARLGWQNQGSMPDPREPYSDWVFEVARINRIITVYRLVSRPLWGAEEFNEMVQLWKRWIRSEIRGSLAPKDPQEAIYLGGVYVSRMINDYLDRTRFILDLGLTEPKQGEVARLRFDVAMESPLSLLGYIYLRLAQDVAGAARFGRCPECGRVFKSDKGDRRTYDTPQCSGRARQGRYVKAHPEYRKKLVAS